MNPGAGAQVIRLGHKHLWPLNYLTGPEGHSLCIWPPVLTVHGLAAPHGTELLPLSPCILCYLTRQSCHCVYVKVKSMLPLGSPKFLDTCQSLGGCGISLRGIQMTSGPPVYGHFARMKYTVHTLIWGLSPVGWTRVNMASMCNSTNQFPVNNSFSPHHSSQPLYLGLFNLQQPLPCLPCSSLFLLGAETGVLYIPGCSYPCYVVNADPPTSTSLVQGLLACASTPHL